MLRLYPAEPSVEAGATLRLHVAGDEPSYRIALERWGGGCARVLETEEPQASNIAPGWDGQRHWPPIDIPLPAGMRAGAYIARSVADGDCAEGPPRTETPDARWGTALFVVRRPPAAAILVNLPLFTYHAYNVAGADPTRGESGACLYTGSRTVSLLRPGGGTGGHPWDEANVDAYDRASPRQTFAHWDLPALDWLASENVDVDLCTDLDLHRESVPLEAYALMCTFGHDEYWTPEKRRAVGRFLDAGGNVAFFGGNTCWFRVRYDAASMSITRDGKWSDDEPEDTLTGLSYRRGGGKWIGPRPATGYRVEAPGHPFFRGVLHDDNVAPTATLREGDVVGAEARLVGYECDGIDPRFAPRDLCVLARASLADWDVSDGSGEVAPDGHAAMVTFRRGAGTVFNAGSVDWARVLSCDYQVAAITRNVIAHLGQTSSRRRNRTRKNAHGPTK